MRFRSSAIIVCASSRSSGFAAQAFIVYGAWATRAANPLSCSKARSAAASSGSTGFAFIPRGFRVKKAKVSAPIESAVSPILRNPPVVDR